MLQIAISGKSGCGNTTVTTLLSKRLGLKMINYTFRQVAQQRGMSLEEVLQKAKTDDCYDIQVDTTQVDLAKKGSCVLGSRLAIWMLKEAQLKVYLLADANTRALRVQKREGGDLEKIKDFTLLRDTEDTKRYKKLYDIDNNNYNFADIIIDTAKYTPEQIVDIIVEQLHKKDLL